MGLVNDLPKLVEEYKDKIKWNTILDAGCGEGNFIRSLYDNGLVDKDSHVYGIDTSPKALIKAHRLNRETWFYQTYIETLYMIEPKELDFISCIQVIEHVDDENECFEEFNRVLKKDGYLYLTTVFKELWATYKYRNKYGEAVLDKGHLREYNEVSEDKFRKIIEKNGFKIIEEKKIPLSYPIGGTIIAKFGVKYLKKKYWKPYKDISGYYLWEFILVKKEDLKNG